MNDLGMKLDSVSVGIPPEGGCLRALGMANDRKVGRGANDLILMTHPDGNDGGEIIKEISCLIDEKLGPAVFATGRASHFSSHQVGHDLHPITDPQNRNRKAEKVRIADGCLLIIDAGGAPGEDQALGRKG
jgi:hypothetical protein